MIRGSLPWLLRHELRVRWRELTGETKPSTLLLAGIGILAVAHMILWGIAGSLRDVLTTPLPPAAVPLAGLAVLLVFPFGIATGVNHAVVALFDRGDLDLLVSSPLGSRIVFGSRVVAVAASVFVGLGLFMLPIGSIGLMLGIPQLLGVVPTLVALSLVCASIGMLITLLLVRWLGPRRARTVAQLLAAFGGMLLFLATQVPAFFGDETDFGEVIVNALSHFQPGAALAPDSLVWLPFRSMFLHPLGTLVALAGAGLVAWLAVTTLHTSFARGVGLSDTRRARRPVAEGHVRFTERGAMTVLLRKEWKLILRDPYLLSQVLLQVLALVPAGYLLFFTGSAPLGDLDIGPALAVLTVVLCGTLASALARIAVVGEEAGDLLASSPVGASRVKRGKLLASLVPALALGVPISIGIIFQSPVAGVVALLLTIVTCVTVVLMRLWNPVTSARRDVFKRTSMGDLVTALLEGFSPITWGIAAYLLATGSVWSVGFLVLSVALFGIAFARARARGVDVAV